MPEVGSTVAERFATPSSVSHDQRQAAVRSFLAALGIDASHICGISADYSRREITVTQRVFNEDGSPMARGADLVTVTHRIVVK